MCAEIQGKNLYKMKGLNVMTIGLCLLIGMTSCKQQPSQQQQAQASVYPVLKLTTADRTLSESYTAVIESKQYVEVRPQVSGIITDVLVKEGANVRKGETLFIIDTIPYAAAYRQALAAVASAEAQVATAKLNLTGSEELYKQKVISDFELQTSVNSYNTAVANLANAKAQKASAANNLSFTKVKSPVNGSAGMTSIRVGAVVTAMGESLINVSDNSQMHVYFSLPEKEVLALTAEYGSIEKTIAAYPEVTLTLNDGSTYGYKGKIDAISGTVDESTGAVSLRATFPNPDGLLRNGGSGTVIVPSALKQCIAIPQAATYELQNRVFVYKVIDGVAKSAPVEVFRLNNGTEYIVESGLAPGDVIIAEGAGLVREGTVIENQTKQE